MRQSSKGKSVVNRLNSDRSHLTFKSSHSPSTPSVTPVTADGNGLSKGDLVACLDKDLASRIDEIMHRATDCDDGRSFNSKRRSRKRGDPNYGAAICGAEAAALQASPGGPFNDLLLLDMEQLSFGFADAAGAAARAASVVVDFVKDYAPLLAIDPSTAEQLGNYLFALAIDTLIDNNAIGQNNRIPSSLITTSTATSTKSGCPDPTASPVSNNFLGRFLYVCPLTRRPPFLSYCAETMVKTVT